MKPLKIFASLNCILCKEPFVPIARQPRSSRHLICGEVMCRECFEKEKSLKQEERKHQCNYGENCFSIPNFAYYLIDVLSQDCFTLSPILGGYLLKKPSINPECAICHDEYSKEVASKKAFFFYCNHIVCIECFEKRREQNNDVSTRAKWTYTVACPTCNATTLTNGINCGKNPLEDFLTELPEMAHQLEEMNESGYRFCEECEGLDIVGKMFHCNKCVLKLCGACMYGDHRSHKATVLLQKEAGQMSDELRDLTINVVNTYKSVFPVLHKELTDDIQGFEKKLLQKEISLVNAPTFENLKEKHQKCMKLTTDFETYSDNYMPHLRKYDKNVKDLMKLLDDDPN